MKMTEGNAIAIGRSLKLERETPALSPSDRIIRFYEEASMDYAHWSRGLNMHLGFFRWGMNPFDREAMLEQLNIEVAKRLELDRDTHSFLVDLGCGMGGVARSIAREYPRATIKGVTQLIGDKARPVPIDQTLLENLDQAKRLAFLSKWQQAKKGQ